MRITEAVFSLFEQIFASGFTFLVLVVAVRMLTPEALSLYTAFFSLNQSFSFFLTGLVLIPLASSTGAKLGQQVGTSIIILCFLLICFALLAPFVMRIFSSFEGRINLTNFSVAVIFFTTQCIFETARWLSIRIRGARATLPVTIVRFLIFFGGLFLFRSEQLDGIVFALTQVVANLTATIYYLLGLGIILRTIKIQVPNRKILRHLATFGNSFGSFVVNFTAVTLIDRAWGGVGLSVFQAMRSTTNPIGLIGQLIDNHFSSNLAKNARTINYGVCYISITLAITALLVALSIPISSWVMTLVLGKGFDLWWPLFPIMLLASLSHTITRPIFVNWRINKEIWALNLYTLLLIFAITPTMIILWILDMSHVMLLVFAIQSLTCFFPLTLLGLARTSVKNT